jgi:hypothetical protein
MSEFVRSMLIGPPPDTRRRAERKELARLLGQFGHVGSNLNQLTYQLNAFGQAPTRAELAEIKQAFLPVFAELKAILRDLR